MTFAGYRLGTRLWAAIASVLAVIMGLMTAVVVTASAAAAAEAPPPAGALVVYNNTSGDTAALPSACAHADFSSIQAAVSAATAAETIYVCAGTYQEAVTVPTTPTITLLGAQNGVATSGRTNQADETVVKAPVSTTNANDFTYSGTGTGGTINGFTILGNGGGTANKTNDGIEAVNQGSGYDWEYNIIQNTQTGINFNAPSATAKNTISNNEISWNNEAGGGQGSNGIFETSGEANNVTYAGNVFGNEGQDINTTAGSSPSNQSSGLVVDHNVSTDSDNFIVLFVTKAAQITNNTISDPHDTQAGAQIYIGGGNLTPTVKGNTISNGIYDGIKVVDLYWYQGSPSTGVTIDHNTVTNHTNGIEFDASSPLDAASSVTNNTVSNSGRGLGGVNGGGNGIYIQAGSGGKVLHNSSTDNATTDCVDKSSGTGATAGTADTWTGDIGVTSSPAGLCVDAGSYTPVAPTRICDTRAANPSGLSGDAAQCGGQTLQAGKTLTINAAGKFGVPADATAVVLNVASTNQSGPGYVTAYPAGPAAAPTASNLNVTQGHDVANLVTVQVGQKGQVNFTGNVTTDLVVDLEGYFTAGTNGDLYQPVANGPERVCDTRPNNPSNLTGAAAYCTGQTLGASQSVTVFMQNFLPQNVSAVVANVTAVNPSAKGFLTAFPTGQAPPTASNVNFGPGQTIPNRVTVPVGYDAITVYSDVPTDVIVDLDGWYSAPGSATTGSLFVPQSPQRICDTRVPNSLTPPADQCNSKTLQANASQTVQVGGDFSVPTDATAATLNVTAVSPSAPTYLTVYPQSTKPVVSDLNPVTGQIEPNMTITGLADGTTASPKGSFQIYNYTGTVDAVVDLNGWYQPNSDFGPKA